MVVSNVVIIVKNRSIFEENFKTNAGIVFVADLGANVCRTKKDGPLFVRRPGSGFEFNVLIKRRLKMYFIQVNKLALHFKMYTNN